MTPESNYQEEFDNKLDELKKDFQQIQADPDYRFELEKIKGIRLINFRSVNNNMIENSEILNAIIVPEWANNAQFMASDDVAQAQFENYYADRMLDYPDDKWRTPVKIALDYCNYDYDINGGDKLENYYEAFIPESEALEKYIASRKQTDKLLSMAKKYGQKYPNDQNK